MMPDCRGPRHAALTVCACLLMFGEGRGLCCHHWPCAGPCGMTASIVRECHAVCGRKTFAPQLITLSGLPNLTTYQPGWSGTCRLCDGLFKWEGIGSARSVGNWDCGIQLENVNGFTMTGMYV